MTRVAVIGAGSVGLASAAIVALLKEKGFDVVDAYPCDMSVLQERVPVLSKLSELPELCYSAESPLAEAHGPRRNRKKGKPPRW